MFKFSLQPSVSASNKYVISLTDEPVLRETSDFAGDELATAYVNGTITVNPTPSLRIWPAGTNVTLSWPDWASSFALQESTGNLQTATWSNFPITPAASNGEYLLTLPLGLAPKFYRLYKP
jgi:hypothetical protein